MFYDLRSQMQSTQYNTINSIDYFIQQPQLSTIALWVIVPGRGSKLHRGETMLIVLTTSLS